MVILTLVGELIKRQRSSLTYVSWPCGLGKTTCMLELGHILGQSLLPPKSQRKIMVRLELANSDLVAQYQKLFKENQGHADSRITFE